MAFIEPHRPGRPRRLLRSHRPDGAHRPPRPLGGHPDADGLVAVDLLQLAGDDLTPLPLFERKRLLDGLVLVGPAWATNGWYCDGDQAADRTAAVPAYLSALCAEHHHEGILAKRLDSPYLPGRRTRTWLKRKCPAWTRLHAPRRRARVPA